MTGTSIQGEPHSSVLLSKCPVVGKQPIGERPTTPRVPLIPELDDLAVPFRWEPDRAAVLDVDPERGEIGGSCHPKEGATPASR